MVIKVKGGFQIRSHTNGKLYPKVYPTHTAAQKRVTQMEMFKSLNKKKSSLAEYLSK